MRYISVTILHQPDAGQHTKAHFSFHNGLGQSDVATARDFAFRALGEGYFQKGIIKVVFPHAATYAFRFERMGLMGYNLTQTHEEAQEV
jgi:hypothetical protein